MTTVGDLTPRHIGQQVRIRTAHSVIEGQLRDLRVETDWVEDATMGVHPDDWQQVPGRRTASITVGEWVTTAVPLTAEVEVGVSPAG
jgi:hypothetical protein